jgi:hypothetical protein
MKNSCKNILVPPSIPIDWKDIMAKVSVTDQYSDYLQEKIVDTDDLGSYGILIEKITANNGKPAGYEQLIIKLDPELYPLPTDKGQMLYSVINPSAPPSHKWTLLDAPVLLLPLIPFLSNDINGLPIWSGLQENSVHNFNSRAGDVYLLAGTHISIDEVDVSGLSPFPIWEYTINNTLTFSNGVQITGENVTADLIAGDNIVLTAVGNSIEISCPFLPPLPIYTANNGLNMSSNNVQMGGLIVRDSVVTSTADVSLTFESFLEIRNSNQLLNGLIFNSVNNANPAIAERFKWIVNNLPDVSQVPLLQFGQVYQEDGFLKVVF